MTACAAIGALESGLGEEATPVLPRHERLGLVAPAGVGGEEPPAVGEPERDLRKGVGPQHLVDNHNAAVPHQPVAVAHGVGHVGRGVQHVGGDADVVRVGGEALHAWVDVDVEQLVLHEGLRVGKALLRLHQEDLRHVGEHVLGASLAHHRQNRRGGATRAGTNLNDVQLAAGRQLAAHRRDGGHDALVVKRARDGRLVHRQHHVHGAAREEEFLVRRRAQQYLGQAGSAPLGQPQLGSATVLLHHLVHRAALDERRLLHAPGVEQLMMPPDDLGALGLALHVGDISLAERLHRHRLSHQVGVVDSGVLVFGKGAAAGH
eukprot:scaffold10814_cov112-Isochrysis_galbana.AAC.3